MAEQIVEDYAALRASDLIAARHRRDGRAHRQRAGLPPGVFDGLARDHAGVPMVPDGRPALEVVASTFGAIRQRLPIAVTPCQFSGMRVWLVCACGKRRAVVHQPRAGSCGEWRCRQCWGLLYETQVWGGHDARRLSVATRLVRNAIWWGSQVHAGWRAGIRDAPGIGSQEAKRRAERGEAQHVCAGLAAAREFERLSERAATRQESQQHHVSVVVRHDPIRPFVHPLLRAAADEDAVEGAVALSDDSVASDAGSRSVMEGLMRYRALVDIEGRDGTRRRALRAAMDLMESADTRVALRGVDLVLQLLTNDTDRC